MLKCSFLGLSQISVNVEIPAHKRLSTVTSTLLWFRWWVPCTFTLSSLPLLDTLAKKFRLLLEEQWNCYPVVNIYSAILEFLMPTGGFYTVTSLQGVLLSPCKPACQPLLPPHTAAGTRGLILSTGGLYPFTVLWVLLLTDMMRKSHYLAWF